MVSEEDILTKSGSLPRQSDRDKAIAVSSTNPNVVLVVRTPDGIKTVFSARGIPFDNRFFRAESLQGEGNLLLERSNVIGFGQFGAPPQPLTALQTIPRQPPPGETTPAVEQQPIQVQGAGFTGAAGFTGIALPPTQQEIARVSRQPFTPALFTPIGGGVTATPPPTPPPQPQPAPTPTPAVSQDPADDVRDLSIFDQVEENVRVGGQQAIEGIVSGASEVISGVRERGFAPVFELREEIGEVLPREVTEERLFLAPQTEVSRTRQELELTELKFTDILTGVGRGGLGAITAPLIAVDIGRGEITPTEVIGGLVEEATQRPLSFAVGLAGAGVVTGGVGIKPKVTRRTRVTELIGAEQRVVATGQTGIREAVGRNTPLDIIATRKTLPKNINKQALLEQLRQLGNREAIKTVEKIKGAKVSTEVVKDVRKIITRERIVKGTPPRVTEGDVVLFEGFETATQKVLRRKGKPTTARAQQVEIERQLRPVGVRELFPEEKFTVIDSDIPFRQKTPFSTTFKKEPKVKKKTQEGRLSRIFKQVEQDLGDLALQLEGPRQIRQIQPTLPIVLKAEALPSELGLVGEPSKAAIALLKTPRLTPELATEIPIEFGAPPEKIGISPRAGITTGLAQTPAQRARQSFLVDAGIELDLFQRQRQEPRQRQIIDTSTDIIVDTGTGFRTGLVSRLRDIPPPTPPRRQPTPFFTPAPTPPTRRQLFPEFDEDEFLLQPDRRKRKRKKRGRVFGVTPSLAGVVLDVKTDFAPEQELTGQELRGI